MEALAALTAVGGAVTVVGSFPIAQPTPEPSTPPEQSAAASVAQVVGASNASGIVAFLGPRGTYSHEAATQHFGPTVLAQAHLLRPSRHLTGRQAAVMPCGTIEEVACAVEPSGDATYAVLPFSNSNNGAVPPTLAVLARTPSLVAVGSVAVRVDHCLLSHSPLNEVPHTALKPLSRRLTGCEQVREVRSKREALLQCSGWLDANVPDAVSLRPSPLCECCGLTVLAGEGSHRLDRRRR